MRTLFYQLSDAYAEFYITSEHVPVDEVIVLFRRRVIYKHCNMSSCTYDMNVYLGKDKQNVTQKQLHT
jgi:hypothetical protein